MAWVRVTAWRRDGDREKLVEAAELRAGESRPIAAVTVIAIHAGAIDLTVAREVVAPPIASRQGFD